MTTSPLAAQVDAQLVATTVEVRVAELRNDACRRAVGLLRLGFPLHAEQLMRLSVARQARLAGCGDVTLPLVPEVLS